MKQFIQLERDSSSNCLLSCLHIFVAERTNFELNAVEIAVANHPLLAKPRPRTNLQVVVVRL